MPPEITQDIPHQRQHGLRVNLPQPPFASSNVISSIYHGTMSSSRLFTISDVVGRDEKPPAYKDLHNEELPSYNDVMKGQPYPMEVQIINESWKHT